MAQQKKPASPHPRPEPDRLARRVAWLERLAGYGLSAACMATFWMVLKLPGWSFVKVVAALWLCRAYWIAALLFELTYAGPRTCRRLATGRAARAPAPPPLVGDARRADIGRAVVAYYMVGGFCLLVLFSVADRGPFAAAADRLRPALGSVTSICSFVLGFIAFVLPLALLALLPRAEGWPMLAAARDVVRPKGPATGAQRRRSRSAAHGQASR